MTGYIMAAIVGVICVILGYINRKGNISSLHEYHRNKVKEEDILPYGKLIGLGMIIIGISIIISSILSIISLWLNINILITIGTAIMIIGIIIGCVIVFKAMIKYNKGIF